MAKIHYELLMQEDIDAVRAKAALSYRQEQVFGALLRGSLLDEGIAMSLGMSRATYYRVKKQMQDKVRRVLNLA